MLGESSKQILYFNKFKRQHTDITVKQREQTIHRSTVWLRGVALLWSQWSSYIYQVTSILYVFSSISLSRSPLEQLEAEKEEREQKLKKMEQEMEQVFEMKVKEKKKKLKDSEAEVSGIVEQRSEVVQLGFTLGADVFQAVLGTLIGW